MPIVKSVTLRQKSYNMIFDSSEQRPKHGNFMEYLVEVVSLVCSIAFVVGSYCFQSTGRVYRYGDIIFIVACMVNTLFSVLEVFEKRHHAVITSAKERDETIEALMSLLANVTFTVGCVFFYPSISKDFDLSANLGAWFCITGSFGLTFSVFFMALGFGASPGRSTLEPSAEALARQIGKLNICCVLLGTVFFTVGSFMYRPIFGGKCEPGSSNDVCIAVATYGTKCYVYGSYLFVLSSIFGIALAYTKAHGRIENDQPNETSKLIPDP